MNECRQVGQGFPRPEWIWWVIEEGKVKKELGLRKMWAYRFCGSALKGEFYDTLSALLEKRQLRECSKTPDFVRLFEKESRSRGNKAHR